MIYQSDAIAALSRMLSAKHTMSGLNQITQMRTFRRERSCLAYSHRTREERELGDSLGAFEVLNGTMDVRSTARSKDCATPRLLIAQKNWAEADKIRDELLAQGIQLKDGKDPVSGERVTTWEVKR